MTKKVNSFLKAQFRKVTPEEVLSRIEEIKSWEVEKNFDPKEVYEWGNCGNMFMLLRQTFPCAVPYVVDGPHIITRIRGHYYDVNGVKDEELKEYYQFRIADSRDLENYSYNYNKQIYCYATSREEEPKEPLIPLSTRLRTVRRAIMPNAIKNFKQALRITEKFADLLS